MPEVLPDISHKIFRKGYFLKNGGICSIWLTLFVQCREVSINCIEGKTNHKSPRHVQKKKRFYVLPEGVLNLSQKDVNFILPQSPAA